MRLYLVNPDNPVVSLNNVHWNRLNKYRVWKPLGLLVVAGLTPSGIPFGAQDGTLTRLFFLICCKDDRTHLHVLARLGRMLQERRDIDRLLEASTPEELRDILRELEAAAIREG
jgi:hypothetical protein